MSEDSWVSLIVVVLAGRIGGTYLVARWVRLKGYPEYFWVWMGLGALLIGPILLAVFTYFLRRKPMPAAAG